MDNGAQLSARLAKRIDAALAKYSTGGA
jgi:hypothetical protein